MGPIVKDKELGVISSDYQDAELPKQNIWEYFSQYFDKYSDLKAVVCTETEEFYTFKDIKEASLRFAKELKKHFQDGEKLSTAAIILPNCIEYPIISHAAMAVGVPICSLRHDYQADLLVSMLKDVNAKVLVTDISLLDTLKKIFEELPNLKVFVRGPKGSKCSFGTSLHSAMFSNEEMMDVEEAKKVNPENFAIVTYSSGTTGKPKAIMLTQRAVVWSTIYSMQNPFNPLRYAEDGKQDRILGNLPFAHIYCLFYYFFGGLMTGTCTYVIDFADAAKLVKLTHKFKLSVIMIRPYMIDAVLKEQNIAEQMKSARVFISAGSAPNPAAVKSLKEVLGSHVLYQDCYGASEVMAVIATPLGQEREGSTGKLFPNVKVKIIDINSGKPLLKPFQKGEMLIKTPTPMKGYLNNKKATEEAFEDGYYKSGDIVYYDNDRYFYVVERFKDLINFRGKKISPSLVENVIKEHKSVKDVGVIGVAGEDTDGEVPRAFVVVKTPVSEQELIDFVKSNTNDEGLWLRGGVQFLDSLPRNHLGKLQRKFLRDMGWTGRSTFKS